MCLPSATASASTRKLDPGPADLHKSLSIEQGPSFFAFKMTRKSYTMPLRKIIMALDRFGSAGCQELLYQFDEIEMAEGCSGHLCHDLEGLSTIWSAAVRKLHSEGNKSAAMRIQLRFPCPKCKGKCLNHQPCSNWCHILLTP